MANYRRGRINEEMTRETADILRTVKDPGVSEALVTVTACDVTADLKYAKVYYSVIGGDPEKTRRALERATGYIRRELAHRLNLRITPELDFRYDNSAENGAHIMQLLKQVENDIGEK